MTRNEIIQTVDTVRPNTIDENRKAEWLRVLENDIMEHMEKYSENEVSVSDEKLLLGAEYKYMYVYYVVSMIDLENQDISMYNNSCAFFNRMFSEWQKKWRRTHTPVYRESGGM